MNKNYDANIGNDYFIKFLQQSNEKGCREFIKKLYLPILARDFNGTTNTIPYKILEQERWRIASQALRIPGLDYTCEYVKAKDINEITYAVWLEEEWGIQELNPHSYWIATMVIENHLRGIENTVLSIDRDSYPAHLAMLRSMESHLNKGLDSEGFTLMEFCRNDRETVAERLGRHITNVLS